MTNASLDLKLMVKLEAPTPQLRFISHKQTTVETTNDK